MKLNLRQELSDVLTFSLYSLEDTKNKPAVFDDTIFSMNLTYSTYIVVLGDSQDSWGRLFGPNSSLVFQ